MKHLIALATLTFTLNSFASSCMEDLGERESWQIFEDTSFITLLDADASLSESEFNNTLGTLDFTYEYCKDAVTEVVVQSSAGAKYRFLVTHEDNCDGGNTYGLVFNQSGTRIAEVRDGEIYCRD